MVLSEWPLYYVTCNNGPLHVPLGKSTTHNGFPWFKYASLDNIINNAKNWKTEVFITNKPTSTNKVPTNNYQPIYPPSNNIHQPIFTQEPTIPSNKKFLHENKQLLTGQC